jgi:hypothetical protein
LKLCGGGAYLPVNLWSDTVHKLRLNIEKETSIPVSHQQLYLSTLSDTTGSYSYTILNDEELISSYGITDRSELLLRLAKPLLDYFSIKMSRWIMPVQIYDEIHVTSARQIESVQKKSYVSFAFPSAAAPLTRTERKIERFLDFLKTG